MTLRTRVSRLEARFGATGQPLFRLEELTDEELNILVIFLCQRIVDDPDNSPSQRAEAEEHLSARQPLPVIDEEQVAAILERVAMPKARIFA